MPRRPSAKHLAKAEQRFKAAVTDYVVSLGARPGRFYDYELNTPAGLLHINVYDNWLATRFDDVARGRTFTKTCGCSCNPYSGKWNFHFYDGTTASLHPDRVLSSLTYYFDCLTNWKRDAA